MEELKKLVSDYYEFITNVLITESELYDNYINLSCEYRLEREKEKGNEEEYLTTMIFKDILYDLLFNKEHIKNDLKNATEFFEEDYSKQETIKIYKKIKKLFPNFIVEDLESEVKQ